MGGLILFYNIFFFLYALNFFFFFFWSTEKLILFPLRKWDPVNRVQPNKLTVDPERKSGDEEPHTPKYLDAVLWTLTGSCNYYLSFACQRARLLVSCH